MAIGPGIIQICGFHSQTPGSSGGALAVDQANGQIIAGTSGDFCGLDDTFTRWPGSHSLRINCPTNAGRYPSWRPSLDSSIVGTLTFSTQIHVGVIYVYFNSLDFSTLGESLYGVQCAGSAGTFFVGAGVQAGGNFGMLYALNNATAWTNGPSTGVAAQTGQWYRIEWMLRKDLGNPWQLSMGVAIGDGTATTVSGNGPANNSVTNSIQTLIVGYSQLGRSAQGRGAMDASFADFAYSEQQAGDYPTGPVQIRGYKAAAVGTHNLDAATSAFFFSEVAGVDTALTTSETTSWQVLDDQPMDASTDGIIVQPTLGAINTPAFRAAGTTVFNANSVANPTTLTPVKSASTVNGDVMVCITFSRSITATAAASAGWTLVSGFPKTSGTASGGRMYVFTKVANGTDTCTITWTGVTTGTTGDSSSAVILSYSNATETFEAVSGTTIDLATTNTITLPSVTTTTDKDYCIAAAAVFLDSAQTGTVTTFTERSDASSTNGSGQFIYTADLVKTPAGATGTGTVTRSVITSARTFGCTIAMKASRPTTQPTNTWYAEYAFEQELGTTVPTGWRVLGLFDAHSEGVNTTFIGRARATAIDQDMINESSLAIGGRGVYQTARTLGNHSPDNANWTVATLNGTRFRFGFASDALAVPIVQGIIMEAMFVSNVVSKGPRNQPIIVRQAVQRAAVR